MASDSIAGDKTTWDEVTEERHASGVEGPPFWHAGQEVVDKGFALKSTTPGIPPYLFG
jgi:hypothetical protein